MSRAQNCLVVLCGLPGSGKTSICHAALPLMEAAAPSITETGGSSRTVAAVAHIEFDRDIATRVTSSAGVSSGIWQDARRVFLERVRGALEAGDRQSQSLVLVDDNMHLTSMRHEAFRMAREAGASFLVVHMQCPWEMCWSRVCARAGGPPVSEDTFRRMMLSFEPPGAKGVSFERRMAAIDATAHPSSSAASLVHAVLSLWGPAPPRSLSAEELEARRREGQMGNERSASHGLDLACRRRIGEAVQAARARGFPKEALREVAREGNAARLGAMEMLKSLVAAAGRGDVDGSGWENGAGGVDGAVAKAWAAFEIAMDVIEAGAALSGMGVTTCGAQ